MTTDDCECQDGVPNPLCETCGKNPVRCTVAWECWECYNRFLNVMAGVEDS